LHAHTVFLQVLSFSEEKKTSICKWPAGIRATGQPQLFYALHCAFLNKLPYGYSEEDFTFPCHPEEILPVGEDWNDWSPILPYV
jgi:hypothetical protein